MERVEVGKSSGAMPDNAGGWKAALADEVVEALRRDEFGAPVERRRAELEKKLAVVNNAIVALLADTRKGEDKLATMRASQTAARRELALQVAQYNALRQGKGARNG